MTEQTIEQKTPNIILMCHNMAGCPLREEGGCPVQTKAYSRIPKMENCCRGLWIPARFLSVAKRKGTEHVDRKAAAKAYLEEYGIQ